jgi:uncharacterized protein YndB with AHSA1/START domain
MALTIVFWIAGGLGLLIAVVLAIASTRPSTFRVERQGTVPAPPEKVFALIADFQRWTAWSPWEGIDPDLKRTFGGAPSGVGATYGWEGKKTGQGRMEITSVSAPSRVTIKLDFIRPFEAHNTAEFSLEPRGAGTQVTWSMHGPQPFMGKVMSVFMSMDAMVGKDFERGLGNLARVAPAA